MKLWKKLLILMWVGLPLYAFLDVVLFGFQNFQTYFVICFIELSFFTLGIVAGRATK